MCLVTGYGIEGYVSVKRLLSSQRREFLVDTYLSLSTSLNRRLKPFQEFYQRNTIFEHSMTESLYLCSILHRFHSLDG